MATGKITVDEGTTTNLATNTVTEDAVTKHLARSVINNSSGTEIDPLSESDFDTKVGSLTETAPATDTASSGLNGRLQRIAQRLSSLIALLPSSLGAGGGLKVDGSGTALPVSGTVAATQSGTWTVQPGNTANTTAWKVDGSAVTQPVSAASLPLPSGAATAAKQPALGTAGSSSTDVITVQGIASGTPQPTAGDVAHDAVDSGNPVKIGGTARTSSPTAVADGDRVNASFTKTGKMLTAYSPRELVTTQQTTITSSTSETTVLTAGGAGVFLDVTGVIVTNTSATATKVTFKDATAGTTRFVLQVPATETRGFVVPVPHVQASANNNWTATCGTSVASVEITMLAIKNV